MPDGCASMIDCFMEETLELLDQLDLIVLQGELLPRDDSMESVELVLHTIKGNAGAFGFDDLSRVSQDLFDRFKSAEQAYDIEWLSGDGLKVARAFSSGTRAFIEGLPTSPSSPNSFEELEELLTSSKKTARTAQERNDEMSDISWEEEVQRILGEAPPVEPRIDAILDLARRELDRETGGARVRNASDEDRPVAPKVAPIGVLDSENESDSASFDGPSIENDDRGPEVARPASESESATLAAERVVDSTDAIAPEAPASAKALALPETESSAFGGSQECFYRGWGFEASCLAGCLQSLLDGETGGEVETLAGIKEFLSSFGHWTQKGFLEDASPIGTELEIADSVVVESPDVELTSNFRDLCRRIVERVAGAIRSGPASEARVTIQRTEDSKIRVSVRGIPLLQRTSAKIKLYPIEQSFAELSCRVSLLGDSEGFEIELSDCSVSLQVLLVQTGESVVAFPSHRISEIREFSGGSGRSDRVDFRGEPIPLMDLSASTNSGARSCVVISGTQGRFQAVRVDAVIERREMLVQALPPGEEVLGFCIDIEKLERVPLLSPGAH